MKIFLFTINLVAMEEVILPKYNKGNILRGVLGSNLRELVCRNTNENCDNCGEISCVYKSFFNTIQKEGSTKLSKNSSITRPFVIKPLLSKKEKFIKDDIISFDLSVFGDALVFLPYIVLAFKNVNINGLGINRGKADLKSITQKNPIIGKKQLVYKDDRFTPDSSLFFTENDFVVSRTKKIKITFLTPTIIKNNGKLVSVPSFQAIINRLRDRFSSLLWFYENKEADINFQTFNLNADKVKIISSNIVYVESSRNTRDRQKQNLSGFVGEIIYEGPITEYMPYLMLGQYFHIGKATVLGSGWYKIENL